MHDALKTPVIDPVKQRSPFLTSGLIMGSIVMLNLLLILLVNWLA